MDKAEILLKSCDFYVDQADKLLKKSNLAKTEEEKISSIKELESLRAKIKFEINQIDQLLRENGADTDSSYDFGGMD